MTCVELVELVTEYLEGPLPPEQRTRFEAHLDECPGCANYLDQMRRTIELTGRLREDDVLPQAMHSLLEAFRGWRSVSPG